MDSSVFVRTVESEYRAVVSQTRVSGGISTSFAGSVSINRRDAVERFKKWFVGVLRNSEITCDGVRLSAEDAIVHSATKLSAVPPYKPLHPTLINIMMLFTRQEVEEIFGTSRRIALEKLTKRG